ncbi:hypothetical protein WOLCODRAFT_24211 [Wolfiporia cocos MD-104 SS10]|uniref:Uncharacterized protein n=1 Tax=Wolfiporia cocos (strain MD-104) TaxID=742152 RepID=A0A2H3JER9_WOLCO|nr:hypothetical protein WOLCODRAFT_24211 [Wolfiporia cocos MD-104 SS10]
MSPIARPPVELRRYGPTEAAQQSARGDILRRCVTGFGSKALVARQQCSVDGSASPTASFDSIIIVIHACEEVTLMSATSCHHGAAPARKICCAHLRDSSPPVHGYICGVVCHNFEGNSGKNLNPVSSYYISRPKSALINSTSFCRSFVDHAVVEPDNTKVCSAVQEGCASLARRNLGCIACGAVLLDRLRSK